MEKEKEAVVLHIGCGMDSRIERVGTNHHVWYDVDFPNVIRERKKYYQETDEYYMIEADVRVKDWSASIPHAKYAIVVMEGVSMYFQLAELKQLLMELSIHFEQVNILMDCYTVFAANASKYKNPINDVGVTVVYGIDDPKLLEIDNSLIFEKEHNLTPDMFVNQLNGVEKIIFKKLYAGKIAKKMYRLYEYVSV